MRVSVLLDLDDDPNSLLARLVSDVAYPLDCLLLDEFGYALQHPRFLHLIGDGVHDQPLATRILLDLDVRADVEATVPGAVHVQYAVDAVNGGPRGEVRPLEVLHVLDSIDLRGVVETDFPILLDYLPYVELDGCSDFVQVVRGNLGCHPDGDAITAIQQEVRKARGQHSWLALGVVEVGFHVDGGLVDVVEHVLRQPVEPALRVAHCGRWVAVYRAEVTLAVYQGIPQREVLGHPDHGVVQGLVAVGVILPHHLAYRAGRLAVSLLVGVPGLVHAPQDSAMDRLEPVSDVGQRSADDYAHRVVDVTLLHLV